jgi:hypothetical protein
MKTLKGIYCVIIISTLSMFMRTSDAFAKYVYVDYSSGAEVNGGTGTSDALKYCPGDSRSTSGVTLSTGDTVYFKRGVTYSETSPSTTGSQGMITTTTTGVTYTVKSDWGTGQATLDGGSSENWAAFLIKHSNTSVLGLSTDYELKVTGTKCWHGIHINNPSATTTGVTLTYLEIADIGASSVSFETGPDGIKTGGDPQAVTYSTFSYCKIYNCEEYGIKISGQDTSHITIDHCEIYGSQSDDCQINVSGTRGDNVTISNCTIRDSAGTTCNGINLNESNNNTIRNNTIYGNTGTGITVGWSMADENGTSYIYGNKVYNNTWEALMIEYNISYQSSTLYVYNNLFENNDLTGTYFVRTGNYADNVSFYNNTLYSTDRGLQISSTSDNCVVKNNIIVGTGSTYLVNIGNTSTTFDYNLLYSSASYNEMYWNGTGYTSKATFYGATGQGQHDVWDENPDLTNPATIDFTCQAGSPAINAGVDLSATFTTDYSGTTRSGTWDIGAYEYDSSSTIPTTVGVTFQGVTKN